MNEANGGMPLLGNPISAVFYPGKLVYAALPYPWAARVYVILHVLLAFGAMVALLRSWGVSMAGAALGGLSYAFAGPVVFQYANVIFLVGAAWMPLGVARDRPMAQARKAIRVDRTRGGLVNASAGRRSAIGLPGWCRGRWLLRVAFPRENRAGAVGAPVRGPGQPSMPCNYGWQVVWPGCRDRSRQEVPASRGIDWRCR